MNTQEESTLLAHGPCDNCGSSDANAEYSDGHHFCFSCETHTPSAGGERTYKKLSPELLPVGTYNPLAKRK